MKLQIVLIFVFLIIINTNGKFAKSHLRKKQQTLTPQKNSQHKLLVINLHKRNSEASHKLQKFNYLNQRQAMLLQKKSYRNYLLTQDNDTTSHSIKKILFFFDQNQLIQEQKSNEDMDWNFQLFGDSDDTSNENAQQYTLNLKNVMNCEYLGPLSIGTPEVTFDVIYDTGSSLTWINSKQCTDIGCQHGMQYDNSQSKTYKKIIADQEVFEFGSGNITAALAQDQITLQGLVLKKGRFYEILKQDGEDFKDGNFEGIVGLGYPQKNMHSIFDDIMSELPQKVFSTYLTRDDQSMTSKLILGGIDHNLYTGKIHYSDVITEDQYWIIKIDKIKIGNKETKICENAGGCKAVLDTGTSFMTGPKNDLELILSTLFQLNKFCLLDELNINDQCSNYKELPDITFVIGGIDYNLSPEEYIITVTRQSFPDELFTHSDDSEITGCVGIFADMDIPLIEGSAWIFGDVFISKFYTVFDRGSNRIGLATAKQSQL